MKKSSFWKRLQTPFYPVYFALFTVLFFASQHANRLTKLSLPGSLLFALFVVVYILLVLTFIRNKHTRSFIAVVFTVATLSYGLFRKAVPGDPGSNWVLKYHLPILITGLTVICLTILAWRFPAFTKRATAVLTATGLFLLVSGSYTLVTAYHQQKIVRDSLLRSAPVLNPGSEKPDIYFLMFDEYTGPTGLQKLYDFDDTPFLDSLRKADFYVADKSTSNYYGSFHSIASSLNMDYYDELEELIPAGVSGSNALQSLIENNRTVLSLKNAGYQYYHIGSWWEHTQSNKNADENFLLKPSYLPDSNFFLQYIDDATVFGPMGGQLYPEPNEKIVPYQIQSTEEIAKNESGPKFIFTHFILPHAPNVFDENCRPFSEEEIATNTHFEDYVNQVKCTNSLILGLVDSIKKNSPKPPIIIVQSDEGQEVTAPEPDDVTQWSDAAILEKFPTISAFYFPDQQYDKLYPSITSVNTFRLILSQYLGGNFPLLPDKNFMMPDYYTLSGESDATARVQKLME